VDRPLSVPWSERLAEQPEAGKETTSSAVVSRVPPVLRKGGEPRFARQLEAMPGANPRRIVHEPVENQGPNTVGARNTRGSEPRITVTLNAKVMIN
jgi:hypothetical protein